MDAELLNKAIVAGIKDSAIPRVDSGKIIEIYGPSEGNIIANRVIELVKEAVAMPINWGSMSLAEGVGDIMSRFGKLHPELSAEALEEVGRCVGWQLR